MVLLAMSLILIGAFVISSVLTEDIDDDDDHQGGMMIPVSVPT